MGKDTRTVEQITAWYNALHQAQAMRLQGVPDRTIAKKLNAQGYVTERGKEVAAKPSPASLRQIDSTYREDVSPKGQAEELAAQQANRIHSAAPSLITMPDPTPTADDVVSIGDSVTLEVNKLVGYEAQFTRGGLESHFVYLDGDRVDASRALGVVFSALREVRR